MNRRDILKTLALVPFATSLGSCREDSSPPPAPSKSKKIHTLQVLLEGPFAVVLEKNKPDRLIAFVPRPEPDQRKLAHDFYFNDPATPQAATKREQGYTFHLATDGLRSYSETYLNPGYADFTAETEKWRLPDSLVKLELPFPDSINFSGRPLHVDFESGKQGMMPTNYILEYYVNQPENIKLASPQMGGKSSSSPNCPPGVVRYFFGVSPQIKDDLAGHARDFFNFMLHVAFPDLEARFRIKRLESSHQDPTGGSNRDSALDYAPDASYRAQLVPAVANPATRPPRLLPVAAVLDCQSGGILVKTNSGGGG